MKKILLGCIKFYQKYLSGLKGYSTCIYYPTCSQYALEAIQKVEAILISEKCRVDRIEEIYVENQEEIIHEFLIGKEFNNEIKKIQ